MELALFKVSEVEIDGFWHRFDAKCNFNPEVNIIIGKNGSGKTTFMNILHSILTADVSGLAENDFVSAKVVLQNGRKTKTIKVRKEDDPNFPFQVAEYQISQKKIKVLRLVASESRRATPSLRRRLHEEATDIKDELNQLVAVSSLSVYRLRSDDDYEIRDKYGSRTVISPVDYRLEKALIGLGQFQLELNQKAREVSTALQSDVLASILYGEDDANDTGYKLVFDKDDEQKSLNSAYRQLGAFDKEIKKKIEFHVKSIDETIRELSTNSEKSSIKNIDIKPLEALRKTRKIIKLSLSAKEQHQVIFRQIELFLETIKLFIPEKSFDFIAGKLTVSNKHGEIEPSKLSSGEKQLLILLVEALLQNKEPHIFLADEPELSLHIAWQKRIIPAVMSLNPNAQVIVATHSPEVASKYRDSIVDMEELIHE